MKSGYEYKEESIVKNKLKEIIFISVIALGLIFNIDNVISLKKLKSLQKNKIMEIYSVKAKEDIVVDGGIIDFYRIDPNKIEAAITDKTKGI